MFVRLLKNARNVVFTMAAAAWTIGWAATPGYGQHQHGDHAGHDAGSAGHQHGSAHDDHAGHNQPVPPHGGQIATVKDGTFEVVYQPKEIRVYLYGPSRKAVSAQGVQGEVTLQVRERDQVVRYPLKYVEPPAGSQDPDYLAVAVDLSRVRDGDMKVGFQLANLPFEQPQAHFAQTFALSKSRLQVTVAAIEPADQAGIARQKTCPVTGEELGSMGDTIKLLVGGEPLYVCCKACVRKVQSDPEAYLRKARQSHQSH
ncbi:MAG: hypothetical protein ACYC35_03380 [Pirellulales bacterium]